jgi:predicted metalloprotease with PDZ domain
MQQTPQVSYRIEPIDPHAHLFEVTCTVASPARDGQRFRLPAWIPGSYLIREFARNFVRVRAANGSGPVALAKEAKDVWRAAPCAGPLTVEAKVFAFDHSVRTAYLDGRRAYFNGPAVFLCPEGHEDEPCTLDVTWPESDICARWRIATTLEAIDGGGDRSRRFRAASYDELIDHPVEMSDFALGSFTAGGVPHDVAISGQHDADMDRITRDLARVCQWHVDLFGNARNDAAPFPRYLFQVTAVGDGYGGLEHRSSTSLLCRRDHLPPHGMVEPTDEYVTFLGLASHEYFHAWHVKRIRPAAFTRYDLSRESYTQQLWAFEGITSYYDDLALVRSGVISVGKYLELLGRAITALLRTPGRHVQSIAEASFDAWIKHYRPDENSPNATVSYYGKGALVALALDLELRAGGKTSLDDLMRALWRRHGVTGIGVSEDGLRTLASDLAGRDLGAFFARYVDGADDPPLAELLQGMGIRLHLRTATDARDRGGKHAADHAGAPCWLGARLGPDLRLQAVYSGGPAERAGLAPNDALVALDGLRASADALAALLTRRRPGARLAVHAFRRDELLTFDVELAPAPLDTCYLTMDEAATTQLRRRREAWLGG